MMRGVILGGVFLAGVLGVVVMWRGGLPPLARAHDLEGIHAPAYDSAGDYLYFVFRATRGISRGPGWEHFTPPAWTHVTSDVVSLRRLELASGQVEEIVRWPESPIVGRTIRTYHGRIFTLLRAQLRVNEEGVSYRLLLSVPRVPQSERFGIQGTWSVGSGDQVGDGDWESSGGPLYGFDESPLNGRWEAVAVPGPEGFPAAIVAFDEHTEEVRTLVEAPSFNRSYPDGVPIELLKSRSNRADIERGNDLERTHDELTERFRREGLSEMEAGLRVIDEMRRLGLYPPPVTIVARTLGPGDVRADSIPIYRIAPDEMLSGVFPDIETALDSLGTPVEKSMGRYVIHRDYENSAALNDYLGAGGLRFYVAFGAVEYELTVNRP